MYRILIFGGTTEGRLMAEYCLLHEIQAEICVTTDYAAQLLPVSEIIKISVGKLNADEMAEKIGISGYETVIDATHPYAVEASRNIRNACQKANASCYRIIRDSCIHEGEIVSSMNELIELLNRNDSVILSTLGSKELDSLTAVKNYRERIWVRALPTEEIRSSFISQGYREEHLIAEKGPFTVMQNISHIKKSGAEILVTKESGAAGGYPEKAEAVRICGIDLITVKRPEESGITLAEAEEIIMRKKREQI